MTMEPVNSGYRSWKNAGPKSVVVMKQLRLELALKLSTILTELLVNNSISIKSICTSRKKCFGKCWLKLIFIDIQLLVLLTRPKDQTLKQLISLVYAIFIHTLCFRLDLFSSKKVVKILDICFSLETLGEVRNGLDHGVITVAPGKLMNTLIIN
jgi:hypothetical protein